MALKIQFRPLKTTPHTYNIAILDHEGLVHLPLHYFLRIDVTSRGDATMTAMPQPHHFDL